jgi:hypothetical protein
MRKAASLWSRIEANGSALLANHETPSQRSAEKCIGHTVVKNPRRLG